MKGDWHHCYSKAGRTYVAIPTSNSLHKHQQAVSNTGSSETDWQWITPDRMKTCDLWDLSLGELNAMHQCVVVCFRLDALDLDCDNVDTRHMLLD